MPLVDMLQNEIKNLSSSLLTTNASNLQNYYRERLHTLEDLRSYVEDREREFFNSFSIASGDIMTDCETLQSRIEDWENTGAIRMVSDSSIQSTLVLLQKFPILSLDEKDWETTLTKWYEDVVATSISEEVKNGAIDITEQFIESTIAKSNGDVVKRTSRTKNKLMDKEGNFKLSVQLQVTDGQPHWTFTGFDEVLKSGYKERLMEAIANYNKDALTQYHNTLVDYLIEQIKALGIQEPALHYICNEISYNLSNYNIAPNFNVVKGFLGEVYWNACFKALGAMAIPIGAVKDATTGRSISIDMVARGAGFQIKNYYLPNDGTVTFHGNGKTAGEFIVSRAGVQEPLANILLKLYGVYGLKSLDPDWQTVQNDLGDIIKSNDDVFTQYIDRIIGLDKPQNIDDTDIPGLSETQMEPGLYVNSFFLINSKIVPSSVILTSIIDTITEQEGRMTSADFRIVSLTSSGQFDLNRSSMIGLFGSDYQADDINVDKILTPYDYANQTKINYEIKLNLGEILMGIQGKIQKKAK